MKLVWHQLKLEAYLGHSKDFVFGEKYASWNCCLWSWGSVCEVR